ncbi:hypothetical protein A9W95_23085 [Mycobacterium sp. 1423905.2]|nr:hypothetical protein A9W95_23085 [Mycobacterium sp. 1423905.2]
MDGIEAALAHGGPLPQSVQAATFSHGARVYVESTFAADPRYTIRRGRNANTGAEEPATVYSCDTSPDCSAPATDIATAVTHGARYTNFAGTARLDLDSSGHAALRPVQSDTPVANLTYRVVESGGLKRITLRATDEEDAETFRQAMGISDENFVMVEYNGQVRIGVAEPGNDTTTVAAYNRIAVNDVLGHWTPALPSTLP